MSAQSDFYRARAIDARADAEAALLDNVRERCLRAAAAWESMADRAARTSKMRDKQEAEKAERNAALATMMAPNPQG
ncbi:MAG TPA: hypothetical protein VD887_09490 [Allosphingosinicella sp.]|nr:hypothetical protein [Allosphingosinicella sp.]